MWGRLSSLGQNITELTKDLATFDDSSDDDDGEYSDNESNQYYHHHYRHDDDDGGGGGDGRLVVEEGEDGASIGRYKTGMTDGMARVAELEEQLTIVEQQNVLITQEYKKLLAEKQLEVDKLVEECEQLKQGRKMASEMVDQEQSLIAEVEHLKEELRQRDHTVKTLETRLRTLQKQRIDAHRQRTGSYSGDIVSGRDGDEENRNADALESVKAILDELRQEIVKQNNSESIVDPSAREKDGDEDDSGAPLEGGPDETSPSDDGNEEDGATENPIDKKEEETPAVTNGDSPVDGTIEKSNMGADGDDKGADKKDDGAQVEADKKSSILLDIVDRLEKSVHDALLAAEERQSMESQDLYDDVMSSLQEFRDLIIQKTAGQSQNEKTDEEIMDKPSQSAVALMETVLDITDRFGVLCQAHQEQLDNQTKLRKDAESLVKASEERFKLLQDGISDILKSHSAIMESPLSSDRDGIAELVDAVRLQQELKTRFFNTCQYLMQSIEATDSGDDKAYQPTKGISGQVDNDIVTRFDRFIESTKRVKDERDQLYSSMSTLGQNNAQLREDIVKLEHQRKQAIAEMETRIQELMNESNQSAKAAEQRYRNAISEYEAKIAELETALQEKDYEVQEMEIDEEQFQMLNENLNELKARNEYLTDMLESAHREHSATKASMESAVAKLQDELEDYMNRERAFRQTIETLSNDARKVKELEESLSSLESVLAQFHIDHESDIKDLTGKLEEARRQLQDREKEIEEARVQIKDYEHRLQQMEGKKMEALVSGRAREEVDEDENLTRITTPRSSVIMSPSSSNASLITPALIASPSSSILLDELDLDNEAGPQERLQQRYIQMRKSLMDAIARVNDDNLVDRRLIYRLLMAYFEQGIGADADRYANKIFELLARTLRMKDHEAKELRDMIKQHEMQLISNAQQSSSSFTSWFSSPVRRTAASHAGRPQAPRVLKGQTLGELWIQFLLENASPE